MSTNKSTEPKEFIELRAVEPLEAHFLCDKQLENGNWQCNFLINDVVYVSEHKDRNKARLQGNTQGFGVVLTYSDCDANGEERTTPAPTPSKYPELALSEEYVFILGNTLVNNDDELMHVLAIEAFSPIKESKTECRCHCHRRHRRHRSKNHNSRRRVK